MSKMVNIVDTETGDVIKQTNAQNVVDMLDFAKEKENEEKKYLKSPFTHWTQLNNEHTRDLMTLAINYPRAHAVLYFLVDQMDNMNAIVVSINTIAELMGVTRQTISQAIKVLKQTNFITVNKTGSSYVYSINDSVFWKSHQKNRQYSKFSAQVIISEEEQEESMKKKIQRNKSISLKEE